MSTFTWLLPGSPPPSSPPPAATTFGAAYPRMLAALLPPGRVWRLMGESLLWKLFEACADELARLEARAHDLLDESDPQTASELLPEYERELEIEAPSPEPVVNATLDTTTMSGGGVARAGAGSWAATLTTKGSYEGAAGNALKLDVSRGFLAFAAGPEAVNVRDGERWDLGTEQWVVAADTVGVACDFDTAPDIAVSIMEAAINADSAWCEVTTPDASGDDIDNSGNSSHEGTFSGGSAAGAEALEALRRARIVARLIARQRYRPVDFQLALAALLGQDAEDVDVRERSAADAAALEDPREIFRFFIYRDPTLPGTYQIEAAQDLVDTIAPSHTAGYVIESVDALYDDQFTLHDRDLLGV